MHTTELDATLFRNLKDDAIIVITLTTNLTVVFLLLIIIDPT